MIKSRLLKWSLLLLAVAAAAVSMYNIGLLSASALARGLANTALFIKGLFPPKLDVLSTLLGAILETLQIAYLGTIGGFLMALPLAMAATRTVFSPTLTAPIRFLLVLIRTIPSLLWALIFVVAFGLGPMAGTFGIAFYTSGYLGKLLYESFEGVDQEVLEAVRSVGCDRLQLMRFAVLPESANAIVSLLLFIFEYNVRASAIIGFVGAGGIGFYMLGYVQLLQYQNLTTAIIVTLAVVLLIDQASAKLRQWILPSSRAALR